MAKPNTSALFSRYIPRKYRRGVNYPGKFILASVVWSAISAVAPGDSTATEYRGAAKRP